MKAGRHNPYALKVELVRGCTMRCPFCALRNMEWAQGDPEDRTRWRYMELSLFKAMCRDLSDWAPKHRLELANRGEPSFHPDLLEMIRVARATLPRAQIMLTTNGDLVKHIGPLAYRKWMESVFDAGANIVLLDCYTRPRLLDMRDLFPNADEFFPLDGTRGIGGNPYRYVSPKARQLIIKDASPVPKIRQNQILYYHNQGGNVDPVAAHGWGITIPPSPLKLMCTRPFRELTVHYDGTVPICCDDWLEQAVMGVFPERGLREIWADMDARRIKLLAKDRTDSPCNRCSVRSGIRPGLENRWFG